MTDNLSQLFSQKIFLSGIGGVSMNGLARMLKHMGAQVFGSDANPGQTVDLLREQGIPVVIGHREKNIDGAQAVIRTAAIHDDNPEIVAARRNNIPVFERAQVWGYIMSRFASCVCVAGTHGKTSTTAMSAKIALESNLDPTVMVGAEVLDITGGLRIGSDRLFVAEACEYSRSFLQFTPTTAVILNVETDHLDYFSGIDEIIQCFKQFALLVPKDTGLVLVNGDDKNALVAMQGIDRRVLTFGLSQNCDYTARDAKPGNPGFEYKLFKGDVFVCHIALKTPGVYNMYNSLAAAAAMLENGATVPGVQKALAGFTGAQRRFQYKGQVKGAMVYDDYAHHPTEIAATLTAAKTMGYNRVICAFQSHTYSRTFKLKQDFVTALSMADIILVAPIYAAREQNTYGISGADLANQLHGGEYFDSFEQIENKLLELAQPGDLILTMGAGDIFKVGEEIIK